MWFQAKDEYFLHILLTICLAVGVCPCIYIQLKKADLQNMHCTKIAPKKGGVEIHLFCRFMPHFDLILEQGESKNIAASLCSKNVRILAKK